MQSGVGREWGVYDEPAPYVDPSELRVRRVVRAVLLIVAIVVLTVASLFGVRVGAEAMLGQCAPSWLTGTDPQLCIDASIRARTLSITGTASLADGAILQVWADEPNPDPDFAGSSTDTVDVVVSGGTYSRAFDLSGWGAGTVTAHARLQMSSGQPPEVLKRYGGMGEHLVGPDVRTRFDLGDPPPQAAEVSTDVDLSAS